MFNLYLHKVTAILRKMYTLIVKRNNKYVLPPPSFFYFEMEWAQKSITATAASNTTHVTMPSRILKRRAASVVKLIFFFKSECSFVTFS